MKNHIPWVDLLRVIACFMVVLAHSCDPFVAQFDANRTEFLSGVFIGSFMRSCVPLFVMISGVLLLPVNMEMTSFYSKRAKRILLPFIFWSLLLPVLYYLYFLIAGSTISPSTTAENHALIPTLKKMYLFIFNFNYDTTPLWYLYMLLGLYLFMPIINKRVVKTGIGKRHKSVSCYLDDKHVCALYTNVCSCAWLRGQLRQYGFVGHLRLECLRRAVLFLRIFRLSCFRLLPGKLSVKLDNEKNTFGSNSFIFVGVCHYRRRFYTYSKILSGELCQSRNYLVLLRH